MAIHNTRARNILKKVYEKLRIYKLKIIAEVIYRYFNQDKKLKVFYRYKNTQAFLHPLFVRNYAKPPINYTTKSRAELFHWWHSCDKDIGYKRNFVIEPIDHFFSVKSVWEPSAGIACIDETKEIYQSEYCKKIIVSSIGQKNIFLYYCPELKHKLELVYPCCIPRIEKDLKIEINDDVIKYLCIVSDFYKKGLDVVIDAWIASDLKNSEFTVVCVNIPDEYTVLIQNNNSIKLLELPVGADKEKELLYKEHDIALIPIHTDGTAVYIEALEYGMPIVTMRSQHSSSFVQNSNGFEIDVPFYFYDFGYGYEWKTWDEFFEKINIAKANKEFQQTIDDMKSIFEHIEQKEGLLLELKKNSMELLYEKFHYKHRNKILINIYEEALK